MSAHTHGETRQNNRKQRDIYFGSLRFHNVILESHFTTSLF